MIDIFKQGGDWHIRYNSRLINMNTEETSTLLLSLFERVEQLEMQVHKRGKRRSAWELITGEEDDDS